WRWVFFVNLPIGLLAFAIVGIGMPWTRPVHGARPRLDLLGAALLALTLVPLLLALTWGGHQYAWDSPPILAMLGAAAVGVPLFILVESRAAEPILPPSLFRNRTFSVSAVVLFALGAGLFGGITMVPTFLQGVKGIAASGSGTLMTPMSITLSASAGVGGQVMTRTGRYKVLSLVGVGLVVVGLALFSLLRVDSPMLAVEAVMVLIGFGGGITFPVFTVVVQNALPFQLIGVATASATFFRQIGATVGVALLTGLMIGRFREGVASVAGNYPAITQNTDSLLNERSVAVVRRAYEATATQGQPAFDVLLAQTRIELASAIALVFVVAAVLVGIGWVTLLAIPELPLNSVSPAELARRHREASAPLEAQHAP
ncbi:MAG: MFS transporter, partial [Dehalococcoidia bacterium]